MVRKMEQVGRGDGGRSFFFYDLETSGLDARADRIMQFAGQRTDLELRPIGEPVNILVRLCDDTLPSPYAIAVTGITPQATLQDGVSEAEFCRMAMREIFTPGTMAVGYNSVRFDDEFMRFLCWRNFYDAYEWEWKDGRSRWDLLDVVRMVRALRLEGIVWPVTAEGKATNRLELLTKLNGIAHEAAHDALSDVEALIDVTRLIREKQPKMFEYLLKMRDKKEVAKLVSLAEPRPFVYVSGRYAGEWEKATVAWPLVPAKNGNVLVYDLRYDVEEVLARSENPDNPPSEHTSGALLSSQGASPRVRLEVDDRRSSLPQFSQENRRGSRSNTSSPRSPKTSSNFFPVVKELKYNRCPAVAPLSVLRAEDWERIGLSRERVEANLQKLLARPDFVERVRSAAEEEREWPAAAEVEETLYDGGFLDDADRRRCEAVRNASTRDLADFQPEFSDPRLSEMLLHYKGRNFPESLSAAEAETWEAWRLARLGRQKNGYVKAVQELAARGDVDGFLLQELQLWYEGVM